MSTDGSDLTDSDQEIISFLGSSELGLQGQNDDEVELLQFLNSFGAEPPTPDQREVGRPRSLINAPLRGIGRAVGGATREIGDFITDLTDRLGIPGARASFEVVPSEQELERNIERSFPVVDGFPEAVLERAGELGVFDAATGGVSGILRALGAGLGGQTAKSVGFGPVGQAIGEVGGSGVQGLSRALRRPRSKDAASAFDAGKRLGLTDKELTPILQSERKSGLLAKIARKSNRMQKRLRETRQALQNKHRALRELDIANQPLREADARAFRIELDTVLEDIPVRERRLIQEDLADLFKSGNPTPAKLMNFWADLNAAGTHIRPRLGLAKGPILKAIRQVDPMLAGDFSKLNQLDSRFRRVVKNLKPKTTDDLKTYFELSTLGGAVISMNPYAIAPAVGYSVSRSLADEMLINPAFQNLSRQFVSALNSGKVALASNVLKKLADETESVDERIAKELRTWSETDLQDILDAGK